MDNKRPRIIGPNGHIIQEPQFNIYPQTNEEYLPTTLQHVGYFSTLNSDKNPYHIPSQPRSHVKRSAYPNSRALITNPDADTISCADPNLTNVPDPIDQLFEYILPNCAPNENHLQQNLNTTTFTNISGNIQGPHRDKASASYTLRNSTNSSRQPAGHSHKSPTSHIPTQHLLKRKLNPTTTARIRENVQSTHHDTASHATQPSRKISQRPPQSIKHPHQKPASIPIQDLLQYQIQRKLNSTTCVCMPENVSKTPHDTANALTIMQAFRNPTNTSCPSFIRSVQNPTANKSTQLSQGEIKPRLGKSTPTRTNDNDKKTYHHRANNAPVQAVRNNSNKNHQIVSQLNQNSATNVATQHSTQNHFQQKLDATPRIRTNGDGQRPSHSVANAPPTCQSLLNSSNIFHQSTGHSNQNSTRNTSAKSHHSIGPPHQNPATNVTYHSTHDQIKQKLNPTTSIRVRENLQKIHQYVANTLPVTPTLKNTSNKSYQSGLLTDTCLKNNDQNTFQRRANISTAVEALRSTSNKFHQSIEQSHQNPTMTVTQSSILAQIQRKPDPNNLIRNYHDIAQTLPPPQSSINIGNSPYSSIEQTHQDPAQYITQNSLKDEVEKKIDPIQITDRNILPYLQAMQNSTNISHENLPENVFTQYSIQDRTSQKRKASASSLSNKAQRNDSSTPTVLKETTPHQNRLSSTEYSSQSEILRKLYSDICTSDKNKANAHDAAKTSFSAQNMGNASNMSNPSIERSGPHLAHDVHKQHLFEVQDQQKQNSYISTRSCTNGKSGHRDISQPSRYISSIPQQSVLHIQTQRPPHDQIQRKPDVSTSARASGNVERNNYDITNTSSFFQTLRNLPNKPEQSIEITRQNPILNVPIQHATQDNGQRKLNATSAQTNDDVLRNYLKIFSTRLDNLNENSNVLHSNHNVQKELHEDIANNIMTESKFIGTMHTGKIPTQSTSKNQPDELSKETQGQKFFGGVMNIGEIIINVGKIAVIDSTEQNNQTVSSNSTTNNASCSTNQSLNVNNAPILDPTLLHQKQDEESQQDLCVKSPTILIKSENDNEIAEEKNGKVSRIQDIATENVYAKRFAAVKNFFSKISSNSIVYDNQETDGKSKQKSLIKQMIDFETNERMNQMDPRITSSENRHLIQGVTVIRHAGLKDPRETNHYTQSDHLTDNPCSPDQDTSSTVKIESTENMENDNEEPFTLEDLPHFREMIEQTMSNYFYFLAQKNDADTFETSENDMLIEYVNLLKNIQGIPDCNNSVASTSSLETNTNEEISIKKE